MAKGRRTKGVAKKATGPSQGGWLVELVPNAVADAYRRFEKLPSPTLAQAITREHLKCLKEFPQERIPSSGSVLDKEYENVKGENFYRLRIVDDVYSVKGDLCALFAAIPRGPRDNHMAQHGRIIVLGFCWWTDELDRKNIIRTRHRYEQYIRRCR